LVPYTTLFRSVAGTFRPDFFLTCCPAYHQQDRPRSCTRETALLVGDLTFRLEHPMHLEPADEGVEPACAGRVLRVHAESVPAPLVIVKFDRSVRRSP